MSNNCRIHTPPLKFRLSNLEGLFKIPGREKCFCIIDCEPSQGSTTEALPELESTI